MKIIFFTRFNRVFKPDDKTRNKVLKSKTWWKNRIEVLKDTVIRSLKNQTDQDFEYYCIFNLEQINKYPHIRKASEIIGSTIESTNPSTEYEPLQLMAETKEDAIFFNIDSDDHVHKDTVKELKKLKPQDGLLPYMDKGYIYDLNTKKLAHYAGDGAEPPFWGIYVPGHMQDVRTIHRYMKDHRMDGHHFQKHNASHAVELPEGMYLYSVHSKNTTTGWKNHNTVKHVRETIRSKKILKEFGYVSGKEDN